MTKFYRITNTVSGLVLGFYEGTDEADALDTMARDAGYADHDAACDVATVEDGELSVVEVKVADITPNMLCVKVAE